MFDFGFGDSYAVRDALFEIVPPHHLLDIKPYLGYADKAGDPELEGMVRDMVEQSTGNRYGFVVMTVGAHMGVGAALMAMEQRLGSHEVYYDELHFLRYPQLVRSLNLLKASREDYYNTDRGVIRLTASPSNPTGILHSHGDEKDTVWDACYHNPIYTSPVASAHLPRPDHACMVGSLGKVTGMNGMRLGWVATDDERLAQSVRSHHYNLTLGVSTTNLALAKSFFKRVDLHEFEMRAWNALCDNRSQLSKLEYLLDGSVPNYGMFWFAKADDAARSLLARAKVTYIEGRECGGTDDEIRITIGQSRTLTRDMVRAVLREDGK
jgi:aspartate/methionine/tyrosine aminotransferase